MRRNMIAILLLVCAFALTAVAQNQPASSQNSTMPAQAQPAPDQTTQPAQTTMPPAASTAPMPANDQTAVGQNAPADQNAVSQMLIERERTSWTEAKAKNKKYFKQGLPANVTATTPNGATEDKPTIDSMVKKYGINDYNLSNFNVTFPSSDRAEVTYTASFAGKEAGQQTRQVVSEWQKGADGQWQNMRVDFK